ncbi:MAG: hypothetical protein F6J93_26985 [Oscillatoria sp. SIO1A7]|nr:hypothetical protein [Oscillatoria sp. SIO1A7]
MVSRQRGGFPLGVWEGVGWCGVGWCGVGWTAENPPLSPHTPHTPPPPTLSIWARTSFPFLDSTTTYLVLHASDRMSEGSRNSGYGHFEF